MARSTDVLCCGVLLWAPLVSLAVPQSVDAAENWQASLALTSDYVYRGISRNSGDPALQAGVTYWNPTGWYVGAWASQINTKAAQRGYYPYGASDGANVETNWFAGISRRLGDDWLLDFKAVGYWFPGDPAPVNYDHLELAVSVAWSQRVFGSLAVSPSTNWFAYPGTRNRPSFDLGLSLQQPLSAWLTLIVGSGYHELVAPGVDGYLYGSASLILQWRRCSFELGYYDTDAVAERLFGARLAGGRTVFTASVSF